MRVINECRFARDRMQEKPGQFLKNDQGNWSLKRVYIFKSNFQPDKLPYILTKVNKYKTYILMDIYYT